MSGSIKVSFWRHRYAMVFQTVSLCCIVVWKCVQRSSCRLTRWVGSPQTFMCQMGFYVSQVEGVYVAPSSMLNVYYDDICLKFASHHFLLYAVYICQKSLNFKYCSCKISRESVLHSSWRHVMSGRKMMHYHVRVIKYITCRQMTSNKSSVSATGTWHMLSRQRGRSISDFT